MSKRHPNTELRCGIKGKLIFETEIDALKEAKYWRKTNGSRLKPFYCKLNHWHLGHNRSAKKLQAKEKPGS